MQIIAETTQFNIPYPTAVAIGKFDGIHLGHQKLLQNILQQKKQGLKSTIFTFNPTPAEFFSGKKQKELMTREEKQEYFGEMGIDYLIEFPMNTRTAATSPEDFVKIIPSVFPFKMGWAMPAFCSFFSFKANSRSAETSSCEQSCRLIKSFIIFLL